MRTTRRTRGPARAGRRREPLPAEDGAERRHHVKARLNVHELSKAGTSLNLEIFASGEKIGELEIGRGGLYWRGGRRHRSKRLSWSAFAERMNQLAYGD